MSLRKFEKRGKGVGCQAWEIFESSAGGVARGAVIDGGIADGSMRSRPLIPPYSTKAPVSGGSGTHR